MTDFADGQPERSRRAPRVSAWRRGALRLATVLAIGATALATIRPAAASTTGNTGGLYDADGILVAMGYPFSLGNLFSTPVTAVNVDTTFYGYIKNDYIGCVVGYAGTYTTQLDMTHTVTHNSGGMITFGNQKGSLLTGLDDLQGLVGLGTFDFTEGSPALSVGFGSWPIPNWAEYGTGVVAVDYSAYTRALVDNTVIPIVGGATANTLIAPRFENNQLSSQYLLLAGTGTSVGTGGGGVGGLPNVTTASVILDQVVELYRATARIHWRIYNGDSNVHTVTLRFTADIRAGDQSGNNISITGFPATGFFYVDPLLGLTTQSNVIPGANLPDTLTVYGERYDNLALSTTAPFAAKTIYRGFNATVPSQVFLGDPFDVRPNTGGFYPTDLPDRRGTLELGIAESLYFGTYTMQPGASQDVYTYYGNGTPTEDLKDDVVLGVETPESVSFNSDAINDPKIVNNTQVVTDPTQLAYAESAFLTPNPIQVQGSVYNRTPADNQAYLTNVSMSLILPSAGLALTTLPGTTTLDTATKSVGTVSPDTDQAKQWYIKATGTNYGVLTYQLAATSKEIGSRTVTRTISVPAVPLHPVTNTSFQLLGFPFQFDQGATNQSDPATIINKLSPSSLQDNPAILYYWVPSSDNNGNDNGHYAIASNIQPGQGYFFRPAATRNLFLYGASPVSGQTPNTSGQTSSQVVQLSLNQGWNMITNPYLYSLPLTQLRVAASLDGQLSSSTQTFLAASSAGLVRGSVFYFDITSGAYDFFDFTSDQATPTLDPWVGYWIFAEQNIIVTFPLPTTHDSYIVPTTSGGEPSTRGVLARAAWATKGPSMNNWTLQLVAHGANGKGDRAAIIGVKPGLTSRSANLPKPPTPASDYVYIGLINPSASTTAMASTTATAATTKSTTRYAEVIQSPSAAAKTWDFEVSSDHDGPVTLQWPNVAALPRQLSLSLINTATGKTTSLRGQSSIQVDLKAGQKSRFQIVAKQGLSLPLAISNLRVVRGGASGRSVGASNNITFSLTQEASVTAQVMTLSGKIVSTIPQTRATTIGENTLIWTGRNQSGAALPVGLYKVVVTARAESGDTATSNTMFTSLR